jgi:hypothetical protein
VFFCKTTQKSVYKRPFCKNMFINHINQAPQKIDIAKSALTLVNKHLQKSLADPLLHPFFPFGAAQKNYILYIESREDPDEGFRPNYRHRKQDDPVSTK